MPFPLSFHHRSGFAALQRSFAPSTADDLRAADGWPICTTSSLEGFGDRSRAPAIG